MRLACVIHRFGPDVAGGSEEHCRQIALQLARRHDVTVLTSCARDHVTWRNEYPAGEARLGPLRLRRFPVRRRRSVHRFAEISEVVFSGGASLREQEQWFRENGPQVPALLDYLESHGREFDRVLFWSFRYYQSFFGLPIVADRAVLVPTAEEDPVMGLDIVGPYFARPAGFVFLTPEEQTLVALRSTGPLAPSCVIGSGLEPPPDADLGAARRTVAALGAVDRDGPFLLYLGRIDPNKGCGTLFHHFLDWQAQGGAAVPLVLAGPANMPIPTHPLIRPLGQVDGSTRDALLSGASLLVAPSPFESLSMVLLEAWNRQVPALVNGRCRVLKGQALRAGGALTYRNFDEFAQALGYLIREPDVARQLGRQGRAYVDREYRWPHVMEKLEGLLAAASLPRGS
jgi:glycosyltransferase involved in cell wall biosynthesis